MLLLVETRWPFQLKWLGVGLRLRVFDWNEIVFQEGKVGNEERVETNQRVQDVRGQLWRDVWVLLRKVAQMSVFVWINVVQRLRSFLLLSLIEYFDFVYLVIICDLLIYISKVISEFLFEILKISIVHQKRKKSDYAR